MKYNKKKKLQQGGTLDIKKIMEEARRNQQEYQAALIAEDAQRTAAKEKIQGEVIQAPSTHINTPAVNIGQVNPNMAHIPKPVQRVPQRVPQGRSHVLADARQPVTIKYPTWNDPIQSTWNPNVPAPAQPVAQAQTQPRNEVVAPVIADRPIQNTRNSRQRSGDPIINSIIDWFNRAGRTGQTGHPWGNSPAPSRPNHVWNRGVASRQQGGKVEEGNQELIADFAIRYLRGQGIAEEDIVGQDGNINPQYVDELTEVIQEVNTPEFWDSYKQDPDGTLAAYMESTQTPEQVEMAKKGAKLKQLKNKKNRMCKCGCKLLLKKEGGKIVEKCSCGCK